MIDITAKPFYLNQPQADWVRQTLKTLTTEQKAGQLFCVMGGDYEPSGLLQMVQDGKVGAVLFRPAPSEVIREAYMRLDEAAPIPLLKAANLEEGGSGAVSDGTVFGWPMLTAAACEPEIVRKFALACAYEGRSAGINWTFSPVCDIDYNYRNPITNVRTYGSDPDKVLKYAGIFMRTIQENGMAACAKHFPGDGVDFRDQHLHPTYNSLPADQWYESYGEIYQSLIDDGLLSIMAGHIVQPCVTMENNPGLSYQDCLPGSLCRELLTGVLREKFGFQGVITTDATIMGGYCMAMERKKALPASVMAGSDMLVFNTCFGEDYDYMLEGIRNGLLTQERLDEAVTRILALKARLCLGEWESCQAAPMKWHRECADKAITLVKNIKPDVLPVTANRYPQVRLICLGKDEIPEGSIRKITKAFLEKEGFAVELYDPMEDDLHGSGDLAESRLTLYMTNYEQASNQTGVRIHWCPKHALDLPRFLNEETCIFVSLANPYLLQDVPRVKTYINAYTATRTVIELVIGKLMGKSPFQGISPVDPFCGLPDARL